MPLQMDLRVGRADNGTPVFLASGNNQVFARVFGAVWDGERALWMYPAFYPAASKVLSDLRALSNDVRVTFSDAASRHVQALESVEANLADRRLPEGFDFVTPPFRHQIDGLCHVYYNVRAALFYDPGLGKSKIAVDLIRLLRHLNLNMQALVLGPKVTIANWGREIDRHSGHRLKWSAITGKRREREDGIRRIADEGADVVLATYDTARNLGDLIVSKLPYQILICDEAHLVKSWDSDRTRATWEIAQKASRRVNMTGSPTQGNPLDLYGQYKILGDCFMPETYFAFRKRFCETAGDNSRVVVGFKNLNVLNARTTFLSSRRTKDECLDLPPRTLVDLEYDLSPLQVGIHNQLVNEMRLDPDLLADQLGIDAARRTRMPPRARMPHRAATLTKLLQVASGFLIKNESDPSFCDDVEPGGCRNLATCVEARIRPRTAACPVAPDPLPNTITTFEQNPKLDALDELLNTLFHDNNEKAIIWCVFRMELALIEKLLTDRGYKHVRVDGDTVDVQAQIDAFNDDASVRIYLAQATTGVGITLNVAINTICYSLPFPLTTYTQMLDRNHRIGQTRPVTVWRLIGRGTPEPAIARLLDSKIDVDNVLTRKIDCLVCPHVLRCQAEGVEPFDPTCVYPRKIARPTIRAHALNVLPEES